MASALALFAAWPVFRAGDRFRPLPTPAGTVLNRDVNPDTDHIRGPEDAPASVVVYAAMNLPYRHHTPTDAAQTAAIALEATDAQDRFWEMHDNLDLQDADVGSDPVVYVNGTRFDGPLISLALSVAVRQQV